LIYRNLICLSLSLVFCGGRLTAQSRPSGDSFCESVLALLKASHSDFNGIKRNVTRHRDGTTDWVPSITVLLICPPSVEPKELSFARLLIGEKDSVGAVDRLRELWINFSATDFTETVTVFGESIKRRVDFEKTVPLENLEMSERREGNYFPSTVHGECYSPTGPRG
jgi:hypothetical protein